MKVCLSYEELIEAGRPRLVEMKQVGDSFADGSSDEACAAFSRQALFVEASVRQTYEHIARLARRADSIDEVVEIWRKMGSFCQSALQVLAGVKDKYPNCGAGQLYDLVLDYKLACDDRANRALEEKECLKMEFPKGILPELS